MKQPVAERTEGVSREIQPGQQRGQHKNGHEKDQYPFFRTHSCTALKLRIDKARRDIPGPEHAEQEHRQQQRRHGGPLHKAGLLFKPRADLHAALLQTLEHQQDDEAQRDDEKIRLRKSQRQERPVEQLPRLRVQ